jgi:DNA-directed RNA polymerase specialized sigma24 family protein
MKKEWVVTQQAFDSLLDWLDEDREQAGQKYEKIRLRLIKIFTCRGCAEAEDLADETIDRVVSKLEEVGTRYEGDPALYFYGVAQKLHLEYLRRSHPKPVPPPVSVETAADREAEYECLDRCVEKLSPENRDLVLRYYAEEKHARIEDRKKLADELGIAVNALRIRAHRIRLVLQNCVKVCLENQPAH